MPRLQILHHKSYHPYNEKNKQRVREDEAKAQAEEEERERQRVDQESKSRLDSLRRKAGSPGADARSGQSPSQSGQRDRPEGEEEDNLPSTSSSAQNGVGTNLMERHRKAKARAEKEEKRRKERLDFDFPSEAARKEQRRKDKYGEEEIGPADMDGGRSLWNGGHFNLFADAEQTGGPVHGDGPSLGEIAKKAAAPTKPDPLTMYLARPDKETKPWYTDREMKRFEEKEMGEEAEKRRLRDQRKDARSKDRHDPLTQINTLLTKHPSSRHRSAPSGNGYAKSANDPHSARQARESSERQRALALIAQRKGGMAGGWDDTPSSAAGWSERIEREKDRAGHRFYGSR